MTAVPSLGPNYGPYNGQDILTFANTYAIPALSITVNMAHTAGTSYSSQYNGFPGGVGTPGNNTTASYMTATYVLNSGQIIPAGYGSGSYGAQYSGNGSAPHPDSGDSWSVTSTSNGITSTLTGSF